MAADPPRFAVDVSLDPDPVIEAYKKDVDRTLIRENLKLTVDERLRNLQAFMDALDELRGAALGVSDASRVCLAAGDQCGGIRHRRAAGYRGGRQFKMSEIGAGGPSSTTVSIRNRCPSGDTMYSGPLAGGTAPPTFA
jgi:hypothetical protein